MTTRTEILSRLKPQVGSEVHVGEWLEITQDMIDRFADATGDHQWIHVDPRRAEAESPYGRTIAHGYLTLSLYPRLRGLLDPDTPFVPGAKRIINYGLDKLRFPGAVPAGSRIRARCTLLAAQEVKDSVQIKELYTVDVDGQDRPACVAEAVFRVYV